MSEVRLIDANALKKAIQNREECKECTDIDCIHCFYDIIDNAPTVELDGYVLYGTGLEVVATDWLDEQLGKDRRRGAWVEKRDTLGRFQLYCNQCGAKAQVGFVSFCGKCGADMRGKEND